MTLPFERKRLELKMQTETIKHKDNVTKLKCDTGWSLPRGTTLLKVTETGNGYIFKFQAHSRIQQDNYICMDYSEADLVFKAMRAIYDK